MNGAVMTVYTPEPHLVSVSQLWNQRAYMFYAEPIQRALRYVIQHAADVRWHDDIRKFVREAPVCGPDIDRLREVVDTFEFRDSPRMFPAALARYRELFFCGQLSALASIIYLCSDEDRLRLVPELFKAVGMYAHPDDPLVCIRTIRSF